VVHRTARAGLRVTRSQRRRLLALLVSAGDVWACVLELNAWRRARQDRPLVGYQELCRELAASGPGTFGELEIHVPLRGSAVGTKTGSPRAVGLVRIVSGRGLGVIGWSRAGGR